jgi:AbrB family looped-hinge helix DNA binding protein
MYYIIAIDKENVLSTVKISPKYQIVIPQKVRESLKLQPGQRIQIILYGRRIELIPERKITDMRGFLKGIDTGFDRGKDRE